jgi:2-haloacid dehalogenase
MQLTDFKVLSFDCYGTLIDWESGMADAYRGLVARSGKSLARDQILETAQDIGSYKPNQRNFDYLIAKLAAEGIRKQEILHTAESLFHDHLPANRAGLASAWIHRRHSQKGFGATQPPATMPRYDFQFTSMAELARAHQEALRDNG